MKIIRNALMIAALGALSVGAVACKKKDEKKGEPAPAQKVTDENKAPAAAPAAPAAPAAAPAAPATDQAAPAGDQAKAGDKAKATPAAPAAPAADKK